MNRLLKNNNKGFTLVELIVVIVIIAILVASLTPAILGVISRANRSADEADARSVMMAAGVAAALQTPSPAVIPTGGEGEAAMNAAFGGVPGVFQGTYRVFFSGPAAVGVEITSGGRLDTPTDRVRVGRVTGTGLVHRDIVIDADGEIETVAVSAPGI